MLPKLDPVHKHHCKALGTEAGPSSAQHCDPSTVIPALPLSLLTHCDISSHGVLAKKTLTVH